jgi:hypothetical protein
MQTYYLHRNRLLFMRRNAPWWSLLGFGIFYTLITFPSWWLRYQLNGKRKHRQALEMALKWHLQQSARKPDPLIF